MRFLLDTHVFLWFISADARLPATWRDAIQDTGNEVFLSVVSIWEAMVKYTLGKLSLPHPPELYLPAQRVQHQITSLPLDEASVCHLATYAMDYTGNLLPAVNPAPWPDGLTGIAPPRLDHTLVTAPVERAQIQL